eukprot:6359987-Prymnesium_polylepis.1
MVAAERVAAERAAALRRRPGLRRPAAATRDEAAAAVDAECSNAKHRCGSERTQQPVGPGSLPCARPLAIAPVEIRTPSG